MIPVFGLASYLVNMGLHTNKYIDIVAVDLCDGIHGRDDYREFNTNECVCMYIQKVYMFLYIHIFLALNFYLMFVYLYYMYIIYYNI